MNIGDMILKLRKEKGLSQEEVAEKLNVTRQTVSKWETGESKPDFDKIIPLCDLFSITTEELLRGKRIEQKQEKENEIVGVNRKRDRAKVLSISVFLYFFAVIWIVFMESLDIIDSEFVVCGFLLICAVATSILIYHFVSTKKDSQKEEERKDDKNKELDGIIALIFTFLYLYISFTTMMWHITWLIWIIYSIVIKIIHLILLLNKGDFHE